MLRNQVFVTNFVFKNVSPAIFLLVVRTLCHLTSTKNARQPNFSRVVCNILYAVALFLMLHSRFYYLAR
jgi:hypothetical protein